ncbi:MAG: ureidoglycolate lyase [Candidatus Daviesbacteria bacterium]
MAQILCQKLTSKSFSPFGEVIELSRKPADINKSQRWSSVSVPNFEDGKPVIDLLYNSLKPLSLDQLEMHSNSTQTFIPFNNYPYVLVVGTSYKKLKAFISNGHQGITLKAGIWHCSPIPIKKPILFALFHRSPEVDLDSQVAQLKNDIILKF